MPNIVIPLRHQSAPTLRYDAALAREAAEASDKSKASRTDWDAIDWEALHPEAARRRRMVNQDFDREFDRAEYHDPNLQLLEQRAFLEKIELRPQAWVEESLELYERNCETAKAQWLPGQEKHWGGDDHQKQMEAERERMVNILHPNAVMRKLRAAGVDARTSEHPNARIWLNEWSINGLVGLNAWVKPQEMDDEGYLLGISQATSQAQKDLLTENYMAARAGRLVRKTLTSLQEPYGPEWSIMRYNERQVATKEKYRGWRTAMLVLIVADILTEDEVDRAFGPPIGEASAWYREQLQTWRQIKAGRVI
jgi:hypothetical protein